MQFENKLVAVMNEKIEPGKVMNALAHMCIGMGATHGVEAMRLMNYKDAEGGVHPSISEMPFIILKANSNKIRAIRNEAKAAGISFVDFTDTMIGGSYLEQIEKSAATPEEQMTYFGIVLYGEWNRVSEMTRKFSLWK